jgi:hypothetical protein
MPWANLGGDTRFSESDVCTRSPSQFRGGVQHGKRHVSSHVSPSILWNIVLHPVLDDIRIGC